MGQTQTCCKLATGGKIPFVTIKFDVFNNISKDIKYEGFTSEEVMSGIYDTIVTSYKLLKVIEKADDLKYNMSTIAHLKELGIPSQVSTSYLLDKAFKKVGYEKR